MIKKKAMLAVLVLLFVSVLNHESVHKEIFRHSGCPDSKIGVGLTGPYTRCLNATNYVPELGEPLHIENEILTYNLIPHFLIIETLMLLIIVRMDKNVGTEG